MQRGLAMAEGRMEGGWRGVKGEMWKVSLLLYGKGG
jgi:hypothetical protein